MNKDFLERARDVGETGRKKKTSTKDTQREYEPPVDELGDLQHQKLSELMSAIDKRLEGAPVQIFKTGQVVQHPYRNINPSWEDRWQLMYGFHPKIRYGVTYDKQYDSYSIQRLSYHRNREYYYGEGGPGLLYTFNHMLQKKYWLSDDIGLCHIIGQGRLGFTYFDDAVEDMLDIAAASYNLQQKNLWEHRPGIF